MSPSHHGSEGAAAGGVVAEAVVGVAEIERLSGGPTESPRNAAALVGIVIGSVDGHHRVMGYGGEMVLLEMLDGEVMRSR